MYTKEQIETALKEFERLGSVQATITLLGYPSSSSLYKWYEQKLTNKKIITVLPKNRIIWRKCRICIKRNRLQPQSLTLTVFTILSDLILTISVFILTKRRHCLCLFDFFAVYFIDNSSACSCVNNCFLFPIIYICLDGRCTNLCG